MSGQPKYRTPMLQAPQNTTTLHPSMFLRLFCLLPRLNFINCIIDPIGCAKINREEWWKHRSSKKKSQTKQNTQNKWPGPKSSSTSSKQRCEMESFLASFSNAIYYGEIDTALYWSTKQASGNVYWRPCLVNQYNSLAGKQGSEHHHKDQCESTNLVGENSRSKQSSERSSHPSKRPRLPWAKAECCIGASPPSCAARLLWGRSINSWCVGGRMASRKKDTSF